MASYVITNYSRGYVVEILEENEEYCESWILLPAENLWSDGARGFLYILAMIYIFLGIAIASDVFMCSIEYITSRRKTVVKWDEEKQERVEKEVLIWNETVANLTLMALGSSAPEILLAVWETASKLGKNETSDGLGTFTIIGSAAFNLLIITAICVVSVPSPEVKRVQELGVFIMTSIWSIFAYIWVLVVVQWNTKGVIDPEEAWITLAFFPILVLMAYCQDNGWWFYKCHKNAAVDTMSQTNVRVVTDKRRGSIVQGISKELGALEREKRHSVVNIKNTDGKDRDGSILYDAWNNSVSSLGLPSGATSRRDSTCSHLSQTLGASGRSHLMMRSRFRFRHAAVRSMLGGKKRLLTASHPTTKPQNNGFTEVVNFLQKGVSAEDLIGKFTFSSPSYSVLESAGFITIDVLFHRKLPGSPIKQNGVNGVQTAAEKKMETSFINKKPPFGTVSIEYETREGSGKLDKDFKYASGKLVFNEDEYKKPITIPIINDNQYEADVDFYVILKGPEGDAGVGDPSISRVTIIDDDEPGELHFAENHCYADLKTGTVTAEVIRQKGCDGKVTLEYSTIDGTARGGIKLGDGCDFKRTEGIITFLHNETSKQISIDINKETKGSKNFIITLKNPSLGAKIGEHGATVAYITKGTDILSERIADILEDDEEDVTWAGQFENALTISDDDPENPLKWHDYLLHFLTFFWKVVFACVPPKHYLGSWPCFVISLLLIGMLTALVEQLGTLLGCVLGVKASVAGITFIALGTSLPDTFASRTAALHDIGADAAIGNVTGSNSVNVFLGLGVPWVISSMYHMVKGTEFPVATDNLVQSVVLFTVVGTLAIIILLIRRKLAGGELGGSAVGRWVSGLMLTLLWLVYVVISSVQAYHPTAFPWS